MLINYTNYILLKKSFLFQDICPQKISKYFLI
jgi:hypothetical protein